MINVQYTSAIKNSTDLSKQGRLWRKYWFLVTYRFIMLMLYLLILFCNMNIEITYKWTHILYNVSIILCFGVQNAAIRIYLRGEEIFSIRVKFISILVISDPAIYNTAWEILEIKLKLKWKKENTIMMLENYSNNRQWCIKWNSKIFISLYIRG